MGSTGRGWGAPQTPLPMSTAAMSASQSQHHHDAQGSASHTAPLNQRILPRL